MINLFVIWNSNLLVIYSKYPLDPDSAGIPV